MKYDSSNVNIDNMSSDELCSYVFGQWLLHEGLRRFGDKGNDAAFGEVKQLHERDTFKPKDVKNMTQEEKEKTLNLILLIEEKRDGRVKGRGVADGRKQRGEFTKEEAASPTAALESILLTCVIDAREGREIATCDIPNVFVQTDAEEEDRG